MTPRLAAIWLVLVAVAAPAWAGNFSHARTYLDQMAVVFKASDALARRLPFRSKLSGGGFVDTNAALRACIGVARSPEELLVYLPASAACFALSDRAAPMLREQLGLQAALGLEREKPRLAETLEEQSVVVMEALELPLTIAQVCVCPPGPGEEVIFLDGFEALQ